MRRLVATTAVSALVAAPLLIAAHAHAAGQSVTVCAKGLAKGEQVNFAVGFSDGIVVWGAGYALANNKCVDIDASPSDVYVDANRTAAKITLDKSGPPTTFANVSRIDFSIGTGESAKVSMQFDKK